MAGRGVCARRPEGDVLASVATDHVRLSYHYLNVGDIDGYGSLFGEQAVLHGPDAELLCGRDELERFERVRQRAGRARHTVLELVASGRVVVAIGCVGQDGLQDGPPDGPEPAAAGTDAAAGAAAVSAGAPAETRDFVDVFVVSDDGLIAERRTFHFACAR